jgi:uncharacterized protein (DUF2252 family)
VWKTLGFVEKGGESTGLVSHYPQKNKYLARKFYITTKSIQPMGTLYERIIKFNEPLLPDMVQLKYKAMAENIFRFYRGTCHLFYQDLPAGALSPSPTAWICGDMHIENFGSYKGDNHLVYFDLNDFDESILGPASWDLARMVTSILIAFDSLELGGEKALDTAALFLKSYSAAVSKGKAACIDPRTAKGIVCTFLTAVEKRKQKELLKKLTLGKKRKLALNPEYEKQLDLDKSLEKQLTAHIEEWIATSNAAQYNFEALDVIFRLVGTGSVGLKRYLFLLKSLNTKNKYLLLDMKQARVSSLQPYIHIKQPDWASEAERVIDIKQRMQYVTPALLGTTLFNGDAYIIQAMQPTADKINFELIKDRYRDIHQVIDDMGMLAASAQLRSSGRQGSAISDELIAYGQNIEWQEGVLKYAQQYAKQVKKDYKEYMREYKKGKYIKQQ